MRIYDMIYPRNYKYIASMTFLIGIVLIMFKINMGGWILVLSGIYTILSPSNPSMSQKYTTKWKVTK